MALITRISRLFRADFNAVLDRIEEPDVLFKQALREMEDDINNDECHLKITKNELTQTVKKIKESENNIVLINSELDICFDSNENELARSQIKRKIELQRYDKYLGHRKSSLEDEISELEIRINENKLRYSSMQQKLALFEKNEVVIGGDNFYPELNTTILEDEIEMAFLREKQARGTS